MLTGPELARAVLSAKDRYAVLSLGSEVPLLLGKDGYLNLEDEDIRRCYTKIAARIHPDKLTGFADATKAFQVLVRAYELCCKPDLRDDESDDSRGDDDDDEDDDDDGEDHEEGEEGGEEDAPSATRLGGASSSRAMSASALHKAASSKPANTASQPSGGKSKRSPGASSKSSKTNGGGNKSSSGKKARQRSNVGCVRTIVRCPRCFADWGSHLKTEGNEAHYSDFMQGVRQVHCLRCLFEFGCLTATHHCAECTRAFEYRPSLYARKITCPSGAAKGKKACGATFGILHVQRSSTKQAAEAAALKADAAQRRKREDEAAARRDRSTRNGLTDEDGWLEELGAFIVSEDCPRCGKQFTSGHAAHLKKCIGKKGSKAVATTGAGGGKKRKMSDAAWVVGSYTEKDDAYREPKRPKAAGAKAAGGSAKAKATQPPAAKKKPAAKDTKAPAAASSKAKAKARDDGICEDCGDDCRVAKKGPTLCSYCARERLED